MNRIKNRIILFFILIFLWLFSTKQAMAATTGNLVPVKNGGVIETGWLKTGGTTQCTIDGTNCYTEVDDTPGSNDGNTTIITKGTQSSLDITFDLNISSIPDGSTITRVDITFVCRRTVNNNTSTATSLRRIDGTLTAFGTNVPCPISSNAYGSFTQSHTGLSITKSASTDFEVGVRGVQGRAINVTSIYADITYTPETNPPAPDPMTFASAPANDSATQISITATTGTDASPPVNYLFTNDNSICGANAGNGGTSSSWQSGTSYSDSGLDPNKCYGFTVTARDSASSPNTGTASGISSTYTSANTPGTPALSGATLTTLNLTNDANSNPSANPATYFAVQIVTTSPNDSNWLNKWVDASGNPSAAAVWQTDAALDALVLQGLSYGTTYGVKVKARNQDNDETSLSAEGQVTTTAAVISVSLTTDGTVAYGKLGFGAQKSTKELADTQTARNDGNVAEDFSIKTSNAIGGTGWTLNNSPDVNKFVHEFSPDGTNWTKFAAADTPQTFMTNIAAGATQNFDLRITAPSSSDAVQKTITITILATQN